MVNSKKYLILDQLFRYKKNQINRIFYIKIDFKMNRIFYVKIDFKKQIALKPMKVMNRIV